MHHNYRHTLPPINDNNGQWEREMMTIPISQTKKPRHREGGGVHPRLYNWEVEEPGFEPGPSTTEYVFPSQLWPHRAENRGGILQVPGRHSDGYSFELHNNPEFSAFDREGN